VKWPWSKHADRATDPDAWTLFSELVTREPSGLTAAEHQLLALCALRQEVNSGGFSGYFFNDYGDSAPVALQALPLVLGDAWAELLQEAMGLFGTPYPVDRHTRQEALLDESRELDARLQPLDTRFYDLEQATDADAALDALVQSRTLP
jgi:hypothetical protein